MNNKYLPIGSVVLINGPFKKLLIVGYHGVNYNGNINIFDYTALAYPEGLLDGKIYNFNHDEIQSVLFDGFVSDEYINLNNILLSNDNKENENVSDDTNDTKFKFNSDGVVVFDGTKEVSTEKQKKEPFYKKLKLNKSDEFQFNDNGIVSSDASVQETPKEKVNLTLNDVLTTDAVFKFDENGVVIADNSNVVKKDKSSKELENIPVTKPSFTFDEFGNVVTDSNIDNNINSSSDDNSSFIFDESGVVITNSAKNDIETNIVSDSTENAVVENDVQSSSLVFDENGVIVTDNTLQDDLKSVEESNKPLESNISPITFDENGMIIPNKLEDSKPVDEIINVEESIINEDSISVNEDEISPITFDENGMIIPNKLEDSKPVDEIINGEESIVNDDEISPIAFDENGVVVSENVNTNLAQQDLIQSVVSQDESLEEKKEEPRKALRFDENGYVID